METPSLTAPGGPARDHGDFARLRIAREQQVGLPIGQYLQPPPMLFTRDGHNVFVGDMYRGHAAFLICSGPSLKSHDLTLLQRRGIVTMAVNNAATVVRPHLWVSVDDPGNFSDAIWYDPGILKFVPLGHMEKHFTVRDDQEQLVPSADKVGDMPCVFGFRRNEAFIADQWLREDSFNWGNHSNRVDAHGQKGSRSVMLVALRLLHYLGIRTVFLLGCDFKMQQGQANYAFEQDRSRSSVRGNNSTYRILNVRFSHLRPHFERCGFLVFNCTPESGLTAFPHRAYEDAIADATAAIPKKLITAGMYDRKARQQDQGRPTLPQPPTERSAVTGESQSQANCPVPTRGAILSQLTLLLAVDAEHGRYLQTAWETWRRFRPEFHNLPMVVGYDAQQPPDLTFLDGHPQVRLIPWSLDAAETQRERMLTAFVRLAAHEVRTDWYLKLDADVLATRNGEDWLNPAWFVADAHGRVPVFVSSPWGYTKPADALQQLDDWGDGIAALQAYPRLNVPWKPDADLVAHPRITSWCFFGQTTWTREMADLAPERLPVPSQDTFLFYCAARRGDHFVRTPMSRLGWEHVSVPSRFVRRARVILSEDTPAIPIVRTDLGEPIPVAH